MKKTSILFANFLLLVAMHAHTAYAQSSEIISAYQYLQNYQQYKEIDDIKKAKEAIDEAVTKLKAKNEDVVPSKQTGKAWQYRGLIYQTLAGLKDKPELSNNALGTAYEAFTNAIKYDDKKRWDNDALNSLMLMYNPMYSQAHNFFQAKEYENAFNMFSKTLAINDLATANKKMALDTTTIYAAAMTADRSGKTEDAKKLYQRLVDLKYPETGVFIQLANIYKKEGNTEKYNEVMKTAKKVLPNSKDLVIEEVNDLLKENKYEEAILKMEEAVQLDPQNPSLYFALGSAYDSKGNSEKAIANYKKSVELDPKNPDVYYNLGTYYYNKGAELTRQMSALDFKEQAKYDKLDKESQDIFKQALPYFEKVVELNPKDANSFSALNGIYSRLNDLAKAKIYKDKYEQLTAPKK